MIPEASRLQVYAFTRPSQQLRRKIRDALLRSLHPSSLYMRLIFANTEKRARTKVVGHALYKRLISNSKEGTNLLKFIYGQVYNDKLAQRYAHGSTNECPPCHMLDFCTHIAGEFSGCEALHTNHHNAACHLVHNAIRKPQRAAEPSTMRPT